jgi:hypothetical protein
MLYIYIYMPHISFRTLNLDDFIFTPPGCQNFIPPLTAAFLSPCATTFLFPLTTMDSPSLHATDSSSPCTIVVLSLHIVVVEVEHTIVLSFLGPNSGLLSLRRVWSSR